MIISFKVDQPSEAKALAAAICSFVGGLGAFEPDICELIADRCRSEFRTFDAWYTYCRDFSPLTEAHRNGSARLRGLTRFRAESTRLFDIPIKVLEFTRTMVRPPLEVNNSEGRCSTTWLFNQYVKHLALAASHLADKGEFTFESP